jgi:hypothetical protein
MSAFITDDNGDGHKSITPDVIFVTPDEGVPFNQPRAVDTAEQVEALAEFRRVGVNVMREDEDGPVVGLAFRKGQLSAATVNQVRHFPRLREVSFVETNLNDADIDALKDLEHLRIVMFYRSSRLGDSAVGLLRKCRRIVNLNLAGTSITDEALTMIGEMTSLESLTLADTGVTNEGLKQLTGLRRLFWLDLSRTKVTDSGMREVGKLRTLTSLWLANTSVGDDGLKHLADLKLHNILLTGTRVTDAGMPYVANWTDQTDVNVSGTGVTNEGIRTLVSLPKIERLAVMNTSVDDRCVPYLKSCRSLRFLQLQGTEVSEAAAEELKEALGTQKVYVGPAKP